MIGLGLTPAFSSALMISMLGTAGRRLARAGAPPGGAPAPGPPRPPPRPPPPAPRPPPPPAAKPPPPPPPPLRSTAIHRAVRPHQSQTSILAPLSIKSLAT